MQGLEAAVGCRPTDTACTGGGSTAGAGARPALQGLLPAAALCLSHSARQGGGGAEGALDRDDEGRGGEQSPLNSAAFKRGGKKPKAKYFDLRNST